MLCKTLSTCRNLVPTHHPSPKLQTASDVVLCSGFSHFGRATPKMHVGKRPFPKAVNVPKIALSQKMHMSKNQHFAKCFPPALFQMLLLPGMQRSFPNSYLLLLDPLLPASQRSFLVGQLFQLLCFIFGTLHQLGTFFQECLQIRACGFLFASQSHLD